MPGDLRGFSPVRPDRRCRTDLPWRFFRRAHFAAFDSFQKRTCKFALTRMAFAMDGTQVKKLVTKCVPFLLLSEDSLKRDSKFAQARCLWPRSLVFPVNQL